MRWAVAGGSGLIGSALVRRLEQGGHDVTRLQRGVHWDPGRRWVAPDALAGVEVVVNLAGAGIGDHRWSPRYKELVRASRVDGTAALAGALAGLGAAPDGRPRTFLAVSAVGYYGADAGDRILTEDSPAGTDFLARLCTEWEAAAEPARAAGQRVVHPRLGLVLTAAGGVLGRMLPPFRLGLGARLGSGRQYLSWITREDAVSALAHLASDHELEGPVNLTGPEPATNAELTAALGRALRRPAVLAAPAGVLRVVLGREMADGTLLASQRALPARLQGSGFGFRHPDLAGALRGALSDR
jgi:uncharacterized protein (TIGR01777 family)